MHKISPASSLRQRGVSVVRQLVQVGCNPPDEVEEFDVETATGAGVEGTEVEDCGGIGERAALPVAEGWCSISGCIVLVEFPSILSMFDDSCC